MSDKQTHRHFTPQGKAAIVKRHLLEGTDADDPGGIGAREFQNGFKGQVSP